MNQLEAVQSHKPLDEYFSTVPLFNQQGLTYTKTVDYLLNNDFKVAERLNKNTGLVEDVTSGKIANAMLSCEQFKLLIECDDCQSQFAVDYHCGNRMCPICNKLRYKSNYAKALKIVSQFKNPRFLTLTFKVQKHICKDDFKRFSEAWRRFYNVYVNQRSKDLTGHNYRIIRAMCTKEIPFHKPGEKKFKYDPKLKADVWTGDFYNEVTYGYHPHLHIIYDGTYMAFEDIKMLWKKATGSEDVVWIEDLNKQKKANRLHAAINYITKYISKGFDVPVECLNEFLPASYGMKFTTFKGVTSNTKAITQTPTGKVESGCTCPLCGLGSLKYVELGADIHRNVPLGNSFSWIIRQVPYEDQQDIIMEEVIK